jgi:hypothetical protein
MFRRPTALTIFLWVFACQVSQAQLPHVLGLWQLDLDASDVPEQFPVASEIRRFTLRDDGYHVILATRVDLNGNPDFIQVAARTDGRDYPQYQSIPLANFQIDEASTPFTYSETAVDEYTVEIISRVSGQQNNRGTRRVSDDGQTMTLDVIAFLPDGQEIELALVFNRLQE